MFFNLWWLENDRSYFRCMLVCFCWQ